MAAFKVRRPPDDRYFDEPWSEILFQGDVFTDVPLSFPWPADSILLEGEGQRRFLSGPFEAGHAMLITPTCTMSAQGKHLAGRYAMPSRTLVPVRPVQQIVDEGAVSVDNLGHLRADRVRGYFYLPASSELDLPESVALLYQPTCVHHDVIKDQRIAQLTGEAFWHLRGKLAAFLGSVQFDPAVFGPVPGHRERTF